MSELGLVYHLADAIFANASTLITPHASFEHGENAFSDRAQ